MIDVGTRLRRLRLAHGLTQRALAGITGVNHSTISLIEQNHSSPSVGVLKQILDGFPLSLSEFFAEEDPFAAEHFHYRSDELTELARGPITLKQVGSDLSGRQLQIMHEIFEAGADTGIPLLHHEGEEGGVVIRGSIELTVAGKSEILKPGDGYYFNSRLPHRFRNLSEEPCEVISACTPPSF